LHTAYLIENHFARSYFFGAATRSMTGFTYGRAEGGSPALTRAYRFEKDMLIQTLTGKHPKLWLKNTGQEISPSLLPLLAQAWAPQSH
jgi:hypothetical protein